MGWLYNITHSGQNTEQSGWQEFWHDLVGANDYGTEEHNTALTNFFQGEGFQTDEELGQNAQGLNASGQNATQSNLQERALDKIYQYLQENNMAGIDTLTQRGLQNNNLSNSEIERYKSIINPLLSADVATYLTDVFGGSNLGSQYDYAKNYFKDYYDLLSNMDKNVESDILSSFASTAGKTSGGSFGQSDFASLLEQNRGDYLTDTSQFSSVVSDEDYSKLLDKTANKSYNTKKTGGSLNASTLKAFGG